MPFARQLGQSVSAGFSYRKCPNLKVDERRCFRHTLAWARLDVDFECDEVLIEEVQTDWLRIAKRCLGGLLRCVQENGSCLSQTTCVARLKPVTSYFEGTLAPYIGVWDEAILSAAANFSLDELGVRTIYYHSFDTGNAVKDIGDRKPPKSLYPDLPQKFCFELTDDVPAMLANLRAVRKRLNKLKQPRWYRLRF